MFRTVALVSLISLLACPAITRAETLMSAQLAAFDLQGNPLASLSAGEAFELRVYVTDVRNPAVQAPGVFAAFVGAAFDPDAFEPVGTPEVADFFRDFNVTEQAGADSVLGGGSTFSMQPSFLPGEAQLLYKVMLQAKQGGLHAINPTFYTDLDYEWLMYLHEDALTVDQVLLTGLELQVVPEPSSAMLGAVGVVGMLLAAWRHRRR